MNRFKSYGDTRLKQLIRRADAGQPDSARRALDVLRVGLWFEELRAQSGCETAYGLGRLLQPQTYKEGSTFGGGNPRGTIPQGTTSGQNIFKTEEEGFGAVRALDPRTGEKKWDFKMTDFTDSGILTTASDVLFTGGREGYFFALDARNGKMLWKASVGGRMPAGPMTYAVNGRQYVSIAAGSALFTFTLRQ